VPYRSVLSGVHGSRLEILAEHYVHWQHAKQDLRKDYPNLSPALLKKAYRRVLESRYGSTDPRVHAVFNDDLDFVWGESLWLSASRFEPTIVDNDAVSGVPYAMDVHVDDHGQLKTATNRVRRSQFKNRTPRGYRPVRPVRGVVLRDEPGSIPILAQPAPRYPVELLNDPLPLEDAFAEIESSFPRIHRRYLQACLAAAICGDVSGGQTPMLCCTGPSGSGKEQHIRLAASFLGDDIVKLPLKDDDEAFFRHIGIALTTGRRFLVFDEFGKTRKLNEKIKSILQISTSVNWRPLYTNRIATTPLRAAIFFPCVRFPDFLTSSAEFCRRTRRAHLHWRLPNWAETAGGDTAAWRDRSADNARIANSIFTHCWRLCHEYDFRFI